MIWKGRVDKYNPIIVEMRSCEEGKEAIKDGLAGKCYENEACFLVHRTNVGSRYLFRVD